MKGTVKIPSVGGVLHVVGQFEERGTLRQAQGKLRDAAAKTVWE